MALEWIKSYKKLERDPKTLHFKALMRWSQSETIGFLHRFWWWADDVAADGNVTSLCLPGVVGGALGYSSDIGDKAVEKLKESGWLDTLESGEVVIHNVDKYRASSPGKREAARERQQRSRMSRSCHADVTRDGTVTDEASHDVTLLDEEEETDQETTTLSRARTPPEIPDEIFRYATDVLEWMTPDVPLKAYLMDHPPDWVHRAMRKLATYPKSRRNPNYLRGILNGYRENGGPDNDDGSAGRNPSRTNAAKAKSREPADFSDVETGARL